MDQHQPWPPKRLLRDLSRGAFYKDGGGWTDDPEGARDFPDLQEVVKVCQEHNLRDVEVVEYFGRELAATEDSGATPPQADR